MHDVHTIERTNGRPALGIVTTGFAQQAIFQASRLGLTEPEKHIVLAEHPISDATADEIVRKADELYADMLRQITSNAPVSEMRKRRLRAAEPSAMCAAGA